MREFNILITVSDQISDGVLGLQYCVFFYCQQMLWEKNNKQWIDPTNGVWPESDAL